MPTETQAPVADRSRVLRRMAEADPELATRLMIQSMPLAAAGLPAGFSYRLDVEGVGSWRISANGALAEVTDVEPGAELNGDAFGLSADPLTLAALVAGSSPLAPLVRRRLRLRGRRRSALALRKLSGEAGPRELALAGAPVDPDLLYRSLPYAIEPEWTRGHSFAVTYQLVGDPGGSWSVVIDDGSVQVARPGEPGAPESADAIVRLETATWLAILTGEITPTAAFRGGLTEIEGNSYFVSLLGRWIDRADGRDTGELEREEKQRDLQARRVGTWGSASNVGAVKRPGGLLDYPELYALWERQNWRAHELDFSLDREHWLATPAEAQLDNQFSFGSFYVGEERVTADLAPFLMAAPSGEIEAFLATQLVDEMRHTVFFDRWMAEVMALDADDMRGRLAEIEGKMQGAWRFLFDDSLRDIADRIKAKPDDLGLFVQGIVTYHMVTEGVLAMPGQRLLIQYTDEHSIFPGFNEGFRLVEQDEHRHIAFGVRFLKDVCAERPEMKAVVLDRLEELLPRAAEVFCPPGQDDPSDFVSYGHHSSQIYGFAYQALKRRMAMIGVQIPGPEVLMPGPVDYSGLDERRPLAEQFAAQ